MFTIKIIILKQKSNNKQFNKLVLVITCLRGKFGINLPSALFLNFEISRVKRGRFQNFKK